MRRYVEADWDRGGLFPGAATRTASLAQRQLVWRHRASAWSRIPETPWARRVSDKGRACGSGLGRAPVRRTTGSWSSGMMSKRCTGTSFRGSRKGRRERDRSDAGDAGCAEEIAVGAGLLHVPQRALH